MNVTRVTYSARIREAGTRCNRPALMALEAYTGPAERVKRITRRFTFARRTAGGDPGRAPEEIAKPATSDRRGLDPQPCWRHLSKEEIRRRITEMVEEIDAQSDPHTRPSHTKRSPAPAGHAASKAARKQMKEAYRLFVAAYREAAPRLRAGDLTAEFPPGCFPPAGPFVPADAALPSSRAGPARAPG